MNHEGGSLIHESSGMTMPLHKMKNMSDTGMIVSIFNAVKLHSCQLNNHINGMNFNTLPLSNRSVWLLKLLNLT